MDVYQQWRCVSSRGVVSSGGVSVVELSAVEVCQ